MRLATANLLNGLALTDGRVDPDRVRRSLRALDADIIGLQEVDRCQPRSGGADLTVLAAEGLDAGYHRFAPALLGVPGGGWRPAGNGPVDPQEPAYGVSLVSRVPVARWHVIHLPAAPVRSPVPMPGSRRVMLLQDEPRVAIAAVLDATQGPGTVVTTHLSFVPGWGALQLRRLVGRLAGLPEPIVLLGDLNIPGRLAALISGWRMLAQLPTYPAAQPRLQLDHALARGSLPAVTGVQARLLEFSDHRALVVDLADS